MNACLFNKLLNKYLFFILYVKLSLKVARVVLFGEENFKVNLFKVSLNYFTFS